MQPPLARALAAEAIGTFALGGLAYQAVRGGAT